MLMMATMALTNWWKASWKYVTMGAAIVAAILVTYFKGRADNQNANEREVLRNELTNRNAAEVVRRDIAGESEPAARLRADWTRPGS